MLETWYNTDTLVPLRRNQKWISSKRNYKTFFVKERFSLLLFEQTHTTDIQRKKGKAISDILNRFEKVSGYWTTPLTSIFSRMLSVGSSA